MQIVDDGGPMASNTETVTPFGPTADFPQGGELMTYHRPHGGMSIRDMFAAQAIQSVVVVFHDWNIFEQAHRAYQIADAMIAERNKTKERLEA